MGPITIRRSPCPTSPINPPRPTSSHPLHQRKCHRKRPHRRQRHQLSRRCGAAWLTVVACATLNALVPQAPKRKAAPEPNAVVAAAPPEKRAANFGLIGAAFGLGFIAGPALGGVLGEYNLRAPFFAAAGLTLLNWLYGVFVLPESLSPENRRAFAWARANPVGALLALQRYPVVFGLAGTYFLMGLAHQVFPSTWVLYTSYRYGWTPRQTGMSLALVGMSAAIVQGGLTRAVIPRLGEQRAAIIGLTISAAAMIA